MPPNGFEVRPRRSQAQLVEDFIASRRDGLSPRTIDNYRLYLKLASEVIGLNTTGLDVQRFITSRKCTNGGKHAYYRCLRAFYNWLYSPKSGLNLNIQDNPILAVEAPKVEKKILPSLTTEQVELLIDRVPSVRDKAIISLFADSGLRLTELANIDPQNLPLKANLGSLILLKARQTEERGDTYERTASLEQADHIFLELQDAG